MENKEVKKDMPAPKGDSAEQVPQMMPKQHVATGFEKSPQDPAADVDTRASLGIPKDDRGDVAKETIVGKNLDASEADEKKGIENKVEKSKPMDVVATQAGYYKLERKNEGDKFTIEGQHQFSSVWMKKI